MPVREWSRGGSRETRDQPECEVRGAGRALASLQLSIQLSGDYRSAQALASGKERGRRAWEGAQHSRRRRRRPVGAIGTLHTPAPVRSHPSVLACSPPDARHAPMVAVVAQSHACSRWGKERGGGAKMAGPLSLASRFSSATLPEEGGGANAYAAQGVAGPAHVCGRRKHPLRF